MAAGQTGLGLNAMFRNSYMSFIGFEPTNGFQLYTDALLAGLLDLAPQKAAGRSTVRKIDEGYSCSLSIVSPGMHFKTTTVCERPQSALEKAQSQLFRQLARWRKKSRRLRLATDQ